MSKCFLYGFGQCSGGISGEHYISASVLRALGNGKVVAVGGLAWQSHPKTMQRFGINKLTANILCGYHNSQLSELDDEASQLVSKIIAVDKSPATILNEMEFDGEKIQRWMLKTIIAGIEGSALNATGLTIKHKKILLGGKWPAGWGLYVERSGSPQEFTQDLFIETKKNANESEVLAAGFRIAGVQLWLLLCSPVRFDNPGAFRPAGLIFTNEVHEKRFSLKWRNKKSSEAVIFTRIATASIGSTPPHLLGWEGL